MSYQARKRARKFFNYLILVGGIGFFMSFLYILSLAGLSDMASHGYGEDIGIHSILVRGGLSLAGMFVSILIARFGLYGFNIQDSWVKYLRRKKHR